MNYYEHHIGEPHQSMLLEAFSRRDAARSPREKSRANAEIRSIRLAAARVKGTHSDRDWMEIVIAFGWRCAMCGCDLRRHELRKDHIVPIYQGGSDGRDNLQPLCAGCNSSKGPDNFNWAAYRRLHGFKDRQP